MDVIALHQAGFGGAVAPLGTALTEEQLAELWRLSPEPVLCFDGDAAGARAAERASAGAAAAAAGRTACASRRCPAGEDPDRLVRGARRQGVRCGGGRARGRWSKRCSPRCAQGVGDGAGAARRAADPAGGGGRRIPDRTLAYEYRARRCVIVSSPHAPARHAGAGAAAGAAGPEVAPAAPAEAERARLLTGILLRHPGLLRDVEEAYAGLDAAAGSGPAARCDPALADHAAA